MSGSFIEYLKYLSLSSIFEIQQVASLESGLVLEKIQYFHSLRVINSGQFPQARFLFSKYSLKTSILLVSTRHVDTRHIAASSNGCGPRNSASLTVASNSTSVVEYGGRVLARSQAMYDAGAYLHWYWRHGMEQVCGDGPLGYPYVFHVML